MKCCCTLRHCIAHLRLKNLSVSQIETADEKSYEFTNIDREELPALQMYIKGYLEVRAAKQQARAQKEAKLALKANKASVIDLDEENDEARGEEEEGGDHDDEDSDDETSGQVNDDGLSPVRSNSRKMVRLFICYSVPL